MERGSRTPACGLNVLVVLGGCSGQALCRQGEGRGKNTFIHTHVRSRQVHNAHFCICGSLSLSYWKPCIHSDTCFQLSAPGFVLTFSLSASITLCSDVKVWASLILHVFARLLNALVCKRLPTPSPAHGDVLLRRSPTRLRHASPRHLPHAAGSDAPWPSPPTRMGPQPLGLWHPR